MGTLGCVRGVAGLADVRLKPFQKVPPLTPQRASVSYGEVRRSLPGGRPSVSASRRLTTAHPAKQAA